MAVDTGKLEEFLRRFIADLGTTVAAGSVVIGHQSPLHRRMAVRAALAGTSNMTRPRAPSR